MGLTTHEILQTAVEAAQSRKASDTVVLDLQGISSVADYFIICSGASDTNVKAIADAVEEKLKEAGVRPLGIEGRKEGTWVLLDYEDIVLHVFHFEKRLTFALEDLWKDAGRIHFESAAPTAGQGVTQE